MNDDGFYTPEEGAAIATFIDQLPNICAEKLSRGVRRGDEWVVGDFLNNVGDSLNVNVKKGCFYDYNPAADPRRGGAIVLFGELFGCGNFDEFETLGRMVEWSRNYDTPEFTEAAEKRDLLDRLAEQLTNAIAQHEADIAEAQLHPEALHHSVAYNLEAWIRELEWRRARATADLEKVRRQKAEETERKKAEKAEERKRNKAEAEEWNGFWTDLSDSTIERKEDFARRLARRRGLSEEVFLWLIADRYVVAFDVDDEFRTGFPVRGNGGVGKVVAGMHIKWYNDKNESSGWYCAPPGTRLTPFIIGDLATADLVIITESTWDAIAYYDLYDLYREAGCCTIATRGAGNASRIPKDKIDREATINLVLQNDEANGEWFARLPFGIRKRGGLVTPPDGVKDLNDWIRVERAPKLSDN